MAITKDDVINALKNVYDLELGFDVVSLGLINDVKISGENNVYVSMTLTTPMCPLAGFMTEDAKKKISSIEDIGNINVELVFEPPWTPDRANSDVRRILGI